MKKLVLVRHAKSGYNILPGKTDFERTLNETGKHEALLMGRILSHKLGEPDLIISSPALRTLETSCILAEEMHYPQNNIETIPSLYHPSVEDFTEVLEQLSGSGFQKVLLVSHNPGITDFINELDIVRIDNMPTCGVLALEIETEDWSEFSSAAKKFLFFDKPHW